MLLRKVSEGLACQSVVILLWHGNEADTKGDTMGQTYTDEAICARTDKMTTRNLDDLLALPIHLRAEAFAEAHHAMNMTGHRPSYALYEAIRTVRERGGRPTTR